MLRLLVAVSAVGAAVNAGVFLAFSTFVMTGLGQAPNAVGLQAMQAINRAAPASPVFMLTLFGTGLTCLGVAVAGALRLPGQAGWLMLAGAVVYLAAIALTIGFHVPRNDALGLLDPAAPGSAAQWREYLRVWTLGNHVRTACCLASAILLGFAIRSV